GPLQELGNVIAIYREAQASLSNFSSLLDSPAEPVAENPQSVGKIRSMSFEDVVFRHPTAKLPAVDGISFQVNSGETIAFVGPSGSGKTTLVKLLVGLYRPQSGLIRFNRTPQDRMAREEFQSQIGMVAQDTQLFSGTIRENLLFVNPDASDEDCFRVLHQAACQRLLERASNGLDTVIGEGGVKVSGGEKQRLSIARALLRNPNVLVFDEATSSLDSLTEEEIATTIRELSARKEHITVMIAHRLSTVLHADTIHVLEKGKIIESGNHDSLLQSKGLYYAMWRQQIGERKG
ncbi:MAG: ABC transporter ATP-binding protein, partial [Flavobacteriales bacterium]